VYLAHDDVRDDQIALKVVHPHLANTHAARNQLKREVKAAARLRHPNALVAWDLHQLIDTVALSMPFHPGRNLAEFVRVEGPLSATRLDQLRNDLLSALGAAHRAGLVHRDLTPKNVMIDDSGAVITDFGLARLDVEQTMTMRSFGTAGYVAPEVLEGKVAREATDLYGLGGVLYFAATGRGPFEADSPVASLRKQVMGDYPPPRALRKDIPEDIESLIQATLRANPDDRPATVAALRGLAKPALPVPTVPVRKTNTTSTELVAPVRLPEGPYRLVIKRHQPHHTRRATNIVSDTARELGKRMNDFVRSSLKMAPGSTPEDKLLRAVEAEFGLDEGVFTAGPEMFLMKFTLLDGVPMASAVRLRRVARDLGFKTKLERVDQKPRSLPAMFFLSGSALVFSFLTLLIVADEIFFSEAITMIAIWMALGGGGAIFWSYFSNKDRPLPPPALPLDAQPKRAISGPVPTQPKTLAPRRAVPTALPHTVTSRLDALDKAIAQATDLPDETIQDLKTTSKRLRDHSELILRQVQSIKGRHPMNPEELSAKMMDTEAHLERLRTLERGGVGNQRANIAQLEASLEHLRQAHSAIERDEVELNLLEARLLSMGTVASDAESRLWNRRARQHHATEALADLRRDLESGLRAVRSLDS